MYSTKAAVLICKRRGEKVHEAMSSVSDGCWVVSGECYMALVVKIFRATQVTYSSINFGVVSGLF